MFHVEELHKVFITADEPLEIRRQNTLAQMKYRAQREKKHVSTSNDGVGYCQLMVSKYTVLNVALLICSRLTMKKVVMECKDSSYSNLRLASYNCRGLNFTKKDCINNLLMKSNI